ncbi:MAG TPA: D-alanyl-D-alanine carboxypeptidase family protein, partial [Cellulomonas sp.]
MPRRGRCRRGRRVPAPGGLSAGHPEGRSADAAHLLRRPTTVRPSAPPSTSEPGGAVRTPHDLGPVQHLRAEILGTEIGGGEVLARPEHGVAAPTAPTAYQVGVHDGWVRQLGREQADLVSAWPGHSEHQTGPAVDLGRSTRPECDFEACFGDTVEGRWVAAHA